MEMCRGDIILCPAYITLFLIVANWNNISVTGQTFLAYRRVLDPELGYHLEWHVNREDNSIYFNVTTRVSRDIAIVFGLSKKGQLEEADVVVFGVGKNGTLYIHDMFGVDNNTLKYDVKQNWGILGFEELAGGQIQVSITRSLDTCDVEGDMIITPDLIHVIWGYVEERTLKARQNDVDEYVRFFPEEHSLPIYFLDRELSPLRSLSSPALHTWRLSRKFRVPPGRQTTYWCSIKRGPRLRKKHHIIGFAAYFKDSTSRRHVHHQVAYRCTAPPDVDPVSVFDLFAQHPGQECYFSESSRNSLQLPVPFCREIIHSWGVGGHDAQLPENTGFPLGEDPAEYFMLETHYDNSDMLADLVVDNGVDFWYTSRLRENDGGVTIIGYGVGNEARNEENVFVVPPHSTNFTVAGQCSPECTKEMVPQEGLEIFAVNLHAHVQAKKMRVRHFRGNKELPRIHSDDNYDFNFQQLRLLPSPVTVLPGDHLMAECVFENSRKNSSIVSGLSTKDEMCNVFVYLNKRIPYMFCSSEYPSRRILSKFGIRNMTWSLDSYERVVTSSSLTSRHIGLPFSEVVDLLSYNWTATRRRQFQMETLYSNHVASCPSVSAIAQSVQQAATGGSIVISVKQSVVYPKTATPFIQASIQNCNYNLLSNSGGISSVNFFEGQKRNLPKKRSARQIKKYGSF